MSAQKRMRRRYRQGIEPSDRFTDMMNAVIGGGSRPCSSCGIARPYNAISEKGICTKCVAALERLRAAPPPKPTAPSWHEPNVIYTDASFRNGVAGLAVVGELGSHSRTIEAASSTHAEVLALRWAMEIARAAGRHDLVFRTDCQAAFNQCRPPKRMGWVVEQIPRHRNRVADHVAGRARIAA